MDNVELKNVEPESKEPKSAKQITLLVLKIVGNVLFYSVIVALFIFSLMNINAGQKNGIPNIFGKGYLRVLSNSMDADINNLPEEYKDYKIKQFKTAEIEEVEGKQKYNYKGDVVNVTLIGKGGFQKLNVGDVITYWDATFKFDDGKTADGAFVTHRIVYTHKENNKTALVYVVGDRAVATRADVRETIENLRKYCDIYYSSDSSEEAKQEAASKIYDYEQQDYITMFSVDNYKSVKAKVTGVNYGAGYTIIWIQKYWLVIFVIPLAIIMAVEIALVIRNIILLRREKNKALGLADHEAQMADLQSEKERMRAELLAELKSQGVIADTPAEEPQKEEEKVEEAPVAPAIEEKAEPEVEEVKEEIKAEEPVVEETKEEAPVEEIKEETPVEEKVEPQAEEAKEDAPMEQVEENSTEETKEEKPIIEEEKAEEPNMSIDENDPEEPKKAPAKKTTAAKKTTTAKKTSTTKTKKETK